MYRKNFIFALNYFVYAMMNWQKSEQNQTMSWDHQIELHSLCGSQCHSLITITGSNCYT